MATISIGDWAKKTNRNLDETVRNIKINLFSGVVMDTRVDTGRMRGNWQTSTGKFIGTETNRLDKQGTQVVQEVEATVKADTVDYLSNNLPYVAVWEEKDGMVKKNMARIVTNIRNEVAKAK
jgi:hypothetical protein